MEFTTPKKVFTKSSNSIKKIDNNYLYSILVFILYIIVYNLFTKEYSNIIDILIISIINILSSLVFDLLFSYIKYKKYTFNKDIIIISLIISIFGYKQLIFINILAVLISIIIKYINKNIKLSSSIYGILVLYITNKTIMPISNLEIFNNIYINPILSIIIFIYLFSKKSIKYNIYISYILTFILYITIYVLFSTINLRFILDLIINTNIFFLCIYILTDTCNTPQIARGQILYGIILGIISSILSIISPKYGIIITLIIAPYIFTKYINDISIKIKFDNKYFYKILIILFLISIISLIGLNILI